MPYGPGSLPLRILPLPLRITHTPSRGIRTHRSLRKVPFHWHLSRTRARRVFISTLPLYKGQPPYTLLITGQEVAGNKQ